MPARSLYFVAIMLPAAIEEEIRGFKKEMAARFESKKALRTASHITLKAPFALPPDKGEHVTEWFGSLHITVAPFVQEVQDFGAFDNQRNPVLFVQPVMNRALAQLQQQVVQQFAPAFPHEKIQPSESSFSPHITIAYRDLSYPFFKEAWASYQNRQYRAQFEVTAFQLLQHSGGRWQVVRHFSLPRDKKG